MLGDTCCPTAARRSDRLVVTTSSRRAAGGRSPRPRGARSEETLTGFKWIARPASDQPGAARFVFGYEEALGYAVGDIVRDKDGITAAVAFLRLATDAARAGESVLDRTTTSSARTACT